MTMKKQYIVPELFVNVMEAEELLASSVLQLQLGEDSQEITITEDEDEYIEFSVREDWLQL